MSQWKKHNINIEIDRGFSSGSRRYHGGLPVLDHLGQGDGVVIEKKDDYSLCHAGLDPASSFVMD
jgi:hypothetical protein